MTKTRPVRWYAAIFLRLSATFLLCLTVFIVFRLDLVVLGTDLLQPPRNTLRPHQETSDKLQNLRKELLLYHQEQHAMPPLDAWETAIAQYVWIKGVDWASDPLADGWGKPFNLEAVDARTLRLRSSGADGISNSDDDRLIVISLSEPSGQ